ncbi:MAG: response regulator transcription factor [Bacteroidales bacterium]|nr:response regulator transcription factor [Bacteroidales bacterium]
MIKPVTRIAVVEDHSFYRNGLCMAIRRLKFTELAFEAANGLEFFEKQRANPADIALIDVMMPVMDGYETVKAAKNEFPLLKFIILTMMDEDETITKFIQAGVQGYLLKNIDNKGLETALKAVIHGRQYFSDELMPFFTRTLKQEKERPVNQVKLTRREIEILQLIFEGLSTQEIADKLFVSARTVSNHRFNLNNKTGAKNTASLISYALKNNLVR